MEPRKNDNAIPELTEEQLNNSTIFSKPSIEHKKPPKRARRGNIIKVAIAPVLIIAIVAGVLLLKANVKPQKSEEGASSLSSAGETSGIKLAEYESDDIKSVSLKNANGEFRFYSQRVDKEDEDGELEWYLEGIDKEYTYLEYTSLTVGACGGFEADYRYDKEEINEAEHFSSPTAEISVEPLKGEPYTITIGRALGSKAGNMQGAYAKISTDEDNVYFINNQKLAYFERDYIYYISHFAPTGIQKTKANAKYFGEGLESFDYIEFKGENVKESYRFTAAPAEDVIIRMESPKKYNVSPASFYGVIGIIEGDLETRSAGVLEFDKNGLSSEIIATYGLDDPCAEFSYKVGDEEVTLLLQNLSVYLKTDHYKNRTFDEIAEPNDNYYAMLIEGSNVIYQVTKLSFDFFEYDWDKFIETSMLLGTLDEIKGASVQIGEKAYEFSLKHKKVTDKETDEEELETTVKYDGKTLEADNFEHYIASAQAIKPFATKQSLIDEMPQNAELILKVGLEYLEKSSSELEVFRVEGNQNRVYLKLNGNPIGYAERKYADYCIENIEKLIKNIELS